MRRICFVGPSNSDHIKKWCRWFLSRGYEVHVVSLSNQNIDGATVHYLGETANLKDSDVRKLKYLKKVLLLRRIVKSIAPDIISVHYASSYGTLAALAWLKNYNLSIWGSDVYDFPKKSIFHRLLTILSLNSATRLLSTSACMAKEASQYTKKKFFITPFGVDMNLFHPMCRPANEGCAREEFDTKDGKTFVVGTVKTLEEKYGIKYLIQAIAVFRERHQDVPIKLRIAGKGSKEKEYKNLATKLGLDDCITWLGFISQDDAAKEWVNMDVGIVYSESESFGVSAVEAQSCGTPVIVSDIPGLLESTDPGVSSLVVPRARPELLSDAIYQLWANPEQRKTMGEAGLRNVQMKFELNKTFETIEKSLLVVKE